MRATLTIRLHDDADGVEGPYVVRGDFGKRFRNPKAALGPAAKTRPLKDAPPSSVRELLDALEPSDVAGAAPTAAEQRMLGLHLARQAGLERVSDAPEEIVVVCAGGSDMDPEAADHAASLPWTLLASEDGDYFVRRGCPVSVAFEPLEGAAELPNPARVLVAAFNPPDRPTDLNQHRRDLSRVFKFTDAEPTFVNSIDALKTELLRVKPHILYVYGHGRFESGVFHLEFADGMLSALDLSAFMAGRSEIGEHLLLTYLNCCEGGMLGFAGAARALLGGGGGAALIANRAKIEVRAARHFGVEILTRVLAYQQPPPKAAQLAMATAPLAEDAQFVLDDTEWLQPVVYRRYQEWRAAGADTDDRNPISPNVSLRLDRAPQLQRVRGAITRVEAAAAAARAQKRPQAAATVLVWFGPERHGVTEFWDRFLLEFGAHHERALPLLDGRELIDWPVASLGANPEDHPPFVAGLQRLLISAFAGRGVSEPEDLGRLDQKALDFGARLGRRGGLAYYAHRALERRDPLRGLELGAYLSFLDQHVAAPWARRAARGGASSAVHLLVGVPIQTSEDFDAGIFDEVLRRRYAALNVTRLKELGAVDADDIEALLSEVSFASPQRLAEISQDVIDGSDGAFRPARAALSSLKPVDLLDP